MARDGCQYGRPEEGIYNIADPHIDHTEETLVLLLELLLVKDLDCEDTVFIDSAAWTGD
ncbi:phosphatidylserine decarboxylase Psd2 [Aspergillus luchuensis]|uniref:Phosphatidylserine decarboxylase Psd2 n=1 Tax=Aspergillus kawachii TaxID=1069201 RepID=A0A146FUK0_ASPKA|nr:phosphatidylserine decarboxylase Psd2 [Aspergillus luchuensis]